MGYKYWLSGNVQLQATSRVLTTREPRSYWPKTIQQWVNCCGSSNCCAGFNCCTGLIVASVLIVSLLNKHNPLLSHFSVRAQRTVFVEIISIIVGLENCFRNNELLLRGLNQFSNAAVLLVGVAFESLHYDDILK